MRRAQLLAARRIDELESQLRQFRGDAQPLAAPVIGEGKAKALLQKLWSLESAKSLAP